MNIENQNFGIADYVIFGLTLGVSAAIGVYFGCFGSKQNTAKEYLFGKGTLKAVPIGLSLYSSAVSVITILGTPAEIYTFGTQFCMVYVGMILSLIITWNFVLPVFSGDLDIKNPYEYFELRFNRKIQIMASLVYIIHTILYIPVILYGGTLVFSECSGISLTVCSTIIGGVCIFYTLLGGFSAVIWSDTLQATLMLATCIFVMIKGIIVSGGFNEVWTIADRGQRLQFFNMNLDPFQRLSFWSAVMGMCFNHAAHNGCGASAIQRYMVLKSKNGARLSTFIGVIGNAIVGWIGCIIGLSMYAFYYNCDPVMNKEINSPNKLVAHYVSQIVSGIPGCLGLFNAGLISAGLSTISAELNTVAGLIYHCFIQKIFKKPFSEKSGANIMKLIVLINGLYYLLVAPLLDKSKYLFPLALTIGGLTYGAKVGMMLLGTTFPKSNASGVIAGTISSFIIIGWISIGALFYDISKPYILPLSVDNCTNLNLNSSELYQTMNSTNEILSLGSEIEPFIMYRLSIMYYPVLGTIITISVGLVVSYITGPTDLETLDPRLIIPRLRPKIKVDEKKPILEMKLLSIE